MGERTNKIYRLGDTVVVKVVQVNLDDRKIDLELVEKGSVNSRRRGKKKR
jgi:ribonuclease R